MKMDNSNYNFNTLLRYRTFEFLCNMNFEQRIRLLQDVFSDPPSEEGWNCIYEFFDSLLDLTYESVFIKLVRKELQKWDDGLLILDSNSKYILDASISSSFVKLVKGVVIYKRETNGNKQILQIAANKNLNHITYLRIYDCEFLVSGMKALIESKTLQNIETLCIENLTLTEDMKRILLGGSFPKLKYLTLQKIGLSDNDYEHISQSTLFKNLVHLDISFNILTDEFVQHLTANFQYQSLKKLIVRGNFMSLPGIQEISKNAKLPALNYLDVSKNTINETDKKELMQMALQGRIEIIT